MNNTMPFRYGAEYDAAALREAMDDRGVTVNELAILCRVSRGSVRLWLNPPPGRRMHWKTINRIRAALRLTEEQVGGIWRMERC